MISNIQLKNYRNLREIDTTLDESVNWIVAPNGSGKTNFLESIYFSIFGSSFRPIESNSELIGPSEDFASCETTWDTTTLLQLVVAQTKSRLTRTVKLHEKRISMSKIPERCTVVLFAPHSVDLASGEPSIRRKDLDSYLSTAYPMYADAIRKYYKVLKNRNAVIKSIADGHANRDELSYWTQSLVATADSIYKTRWHFFEEIDQMLLKAAQQMYHTFTSFNLQYEPNLEAKPDTFANDLMQKYIDNAEKEIVVGRTLYGVHKDDFALVLNGQNVRYLGSRGQQRIASFIFKRAQILHLQNKDPERSITLLIDDIMSELDTKHKENIAEVLLKDTIQVILTGAVKDEIPQSILKRGQQIRIEQ